MEPMKSLRIRVDFDSMNIIELAPEVCSNKFKTRIMIDQTRLRKSVLDELIFYECTIFAKNSNKVDPFIQIE